MKEQASQAPAASSSSPLDAFTGEIPRTGLSLPYTAGLAVVAFAMVLLPTVYFALILLTGWGVVFYMTHMGGLMEGNGGGSGKIILFLGPPAAGCILIFFMLKPLFARRPKRKELPSLDAAKEPLLFEFVERICHVVGAPMPSRIDVDCQVNASASLRRGVLSKDLVLKVGLPLAVGLNMREFAGVLAHEFGHFAQGAGMRLTYVIRNINLWFARVVYERDDWDRQLESSAKKIDIRFGVILHAARGCVWVTRKILWVLMHAGNGISCFMMRQMEYDADSYEAKVAGSDAFESTVERLKVLNAATQVAFQDVRNDWANHRLPENLPLLIDHKARFLPEELRQKLSAAREQKKTGWFDTHPCDTDRAKAARLLAEPGIFRLEAPATGLFSDFAGISKMVTLHQYKENWELEFTAENLMSSDEILRESAARVGADAAIREFYGEVNISLLPLIGDAPPPVPGEFEEMKKRWRDARERCEKLKTEAGKVSGECEKLQVRLMNLTSAKHLTAANFKIPMKDFDLPESVTSVGEQHTEAVQAYQEISAAFEKKKAELQEFVSTTRVRVLLATKLAGDTAEPAEGPGLVVLVSTLAAVGGVMGTIGQMGMRLRAFTVLLQNRGNHSRPETVNAEIGVLVEELRKLVNEVRTRLYGVPYPFRHARGEMTIPDYARYEKPCDNEWETVYRDSGAYVERMYALHYRLMGKLLAAAGEAEGQLKN